VVILIYSNNFKVNENHHLLLHDIDIVKLCNEQGTPLFVLDEDQIVRNYNNFYNAFHKRYNKMLICYSIKTNNNIAICNILKNLGANAEISSEMDLYVANKCGFNINKTIYDGPFKPYNTLTKVIKEGILLINVESITELKRIDKIAGKLNVKQFIGLRININNPSSIMSKLNPKKIMQFIKYNPESRFGFPLNKVYNIIKQIKKMKNIELKALMSHPYHKTIDALSPLINEIYNNLGIKIEYLNIGGGFSPESYNYLSMYRLLMERLNGKFRQKNNAKKDIDVLIGIEKTSEIIIEKIKKYLDEIEPVLITEPGSYLVADSGILNVRVDNIKIINGSKWVVVDGGTNIIPSTNIFRRQKIIVTNKADSSPIEYANIVGPLLYPEDIISLKTPVPEIEEGDLLTIFDCGAYSLSSSNQFLYPRPSAFLLNSKNEVKKIRESETYQDVFNKDIF